MRLANILLCILISYNVFSQNIGVRQVRGLQGFLNDRYSSVTGLSDSSGFVFNKPNGLKDTIVINTSSYSDVQARAAFTLTTTGTSGAASYDKTTGIWNIPNYATAASGWSLSGNSITPSNFIGATSNNSVRFRTNNIERMIIDSLGSVGIGTSSVTTGNKLEVRDGGIFLNETRSNTQSGVMVTSTGNGQNYGTFTVTNPAKTKYAYLTLRNDIDALGLGVTNLGTGFTVPFTMSIYDGKTLIRPTPVSQFLSADTAAASAALEVRSTKYGFLPPRMTAAQMSAIASPSNGLMVYNSDSASIFYYAGSWLNLKSAGGTSGTYTDAQARAAISLTTTGTSGTTPTYSNSTGVFNIPITDGSETKVTAGANVTVSGSGTSASPYVVNSSGGSSSGWGLAGNTYAAGNFLGLTSNNSLRIYTNNTQRVVLDSLGAMTITAPLPTNWGQLTLNATSTSGQLNINFQQGGTNRWAQFIGATTGDLAFYSYTKNAEVLHLNYVNGNVGFNGATPTAKVHIAASSGAANTAPIKLTTTSATLLTTPEAGAFETDGTDLYWTNSAGVRKKVTIQ